PRASISRAKWPLAKPPMAGLQDIWPIVSRLMLKSRVWHPMRAADKAASTPAWPAPTTKTSYFFGYINLAAMQYRTYHPYQGGNTTTETVCLLHFQAIRPDRSRQRDWFLDSF